MKWNQIQRRHFLQGAGKAALTLPFLPSLVSRTVQAQVASNGRQKSFIGIPMWNHVAFQHNADEAEAKVTPSVYMPSFTGMAPTAIAGKHTIHSRSLIDAKNASPQGRISEIIDAAFNPMLAKMNMVMGLDYTYGSGHHSCQFGNGNANGDVEIKAQNPAVVNIDQVMAYSDSFYKNPNLKGQYVHYTGTWRDISPGAYFTTTFTYANPADQINSPVVATSPIDKPSALWDKYFTQFTPPPAGTPDRKKTLVDAVIGDYKAVLTGSRLGRDDRLKIERHVALLQDTQKKVMVTAVCDKPASPVAGEGKAALQAHNDVIVSLIACGLVHSFQAKPLMVVANGADQWHMWSHDAASVALVKQQMNAVAKDVALDLATKLEAQGLLDDSLIAIISEHGRLGHVAVGVPAITFGSAGGTFKTGQYIDYRDMNSGNDLQDLELGRTRSGYPINQFWANMLMAVDVPATEFEPLNKTTNQLFAKTGYGSNMFFSRNGVTYMPSGYGSKFKGHNMSTWLPLIKA